MKKLILRDRNEELVEQWQLHFKKFPEVEIGCGDIFDVPADTIVSPSNSFGFLNGGIDAVYTKRFGTQLQNHLQEHLQEFHSGFLPVGQAVHIPILCPNENYRNLISAPTMEVFIYGC